MSIGYRIRERVLNAGLVNRLWLAAEDVRADPDRHRAIVTGDNSGRFDATIADILCAPRAVSLAWNELKKFLPPSYYPIESQISMLPIEFAGWPGLHIDGTGRLERGEANIANWRYFAALVIIPITPQYEPNRGNLVVLREGPARLNKYLNSRTANQLTGNFLREFCDEIGENAGTPLLMGPGDVAIVNDQTAHRIAPNSLIQRINWMFRAGIRE
jgi:hypothetical protein